MNNLKQISEHWIEKHYLGTQILILFYIFLQVYFYTKKISVGGHALEE